LFGESIEDEQESFPIFAFLHEASDQQAKRMCVPSSGVFFSFEVEGP
jgi:hypothetical protein